MKWLVLFVGALALFSLVDTEAGEYHPPATGEWRYNYLDRSYDYKGPLGDVKVSATYDYSSGDWQFKTPGCKDNVINPFTEGEYPSALQGIRRGYEAALRQKRYGRASEQLELALLLSRLNTRRTPAIEPSMEYWGEGFFKKARMVCIDPNGRPVFERFKPGILEEYGLRAPNDWMISGRLENRGETAARNVWVYVTVYDTMDNLVEVLSHICFPSVVLPGDTAYFMMYGKFEQTLKWGWRSNWD